MEGKEKSNNDDSSTAGDEARISLVTTIVVFVGLSKRVKAAPSSVILGKTGKVR